MGPKTRAPRARGKTAGLRKRTLRTRKLGPAPFHVRSIRRNNRRVPALSTVEGSAGLARLRMEEDYLTDLPKDRIAKYRLMAAQARKAEISEAYMVVATAWETMAVDLQ